MPGSADRIGNEWLALMPHLENLLELVDALRLRLLRFEPLAQVGQVLNLQVESKSYNSWMPVQAVMCQE